MPELPEVEHTRQTLARALAGARITSVVVLRPDVIIGSAARRDLLVGAEGIDLRRHGKQLALVARSGRCVLARLGMTGALGVHTRTDASDRPAHAHVVWGLRRDNGERAEMRFTDARRFGGLWTYPDPDTLGAAHWIDLGMDALTIDKRELTLRLGRSNRTIKAALLDQHVLAGVGNIYADEALHLSRIHPATTCSRLSQDQLKELARRVRQVLRSAVRAGGSTIRDYRDANGESGSFQRRHRVYGRAGLPCRTCRRSLESAKIGQRTTVWCPACQRL